MSSLVLFAVASLIWGSTYYVITLQLGGVPPAVSVVYRIGLASASMFLWCLARGDRLLLPFRVQRLLMLQGFLTFGFTYVCIYKAEEYLISGLVAVIMPMMVFWTQVGARLVSGTPLAARTMLAGSTALLGVGLLFYRSIGMASHDILAGGSGALLIGIALAVSASIASSAGDLVVSKVQEGSSNLLLTIAWSMLWGALAVGIWALLSGQHFVLPAAPQYWLALTYLSVFGSVIVFSCYFALIRRIGAQRAAFMAVFEPVLSVLLSIRFEDYHPSVVDWMGMALCLASVGWALAAPSTNAAGEAEPRPRAGEREDCSLAAMPDTAK